MQTVVLHQGDCLVVMPTLEAESVDTIITDSPYGLKFMGMPSDHEVPGTPFWLEALRVAKPGASLLAFGGTRTFHRLACAIEDAGWIIRDTIMWVYGQGFPKSHNISKAIGKKNGCREASEQWEGWGTALKPAWEPIIVAMKPNDGTFAQNAINYGVAGMWIDGGRIPINPDVDDPRLGGNGSWDTSNAAKNIYEGGYAGERVGSSCKGRWPANLIHDGSSEIADLFPHTTSGKCPDGFEGGFSADIYGEYAENRIDPDTIYGDSGSAARFFYAAKISTKERHAGLEGLFWMKDKESACGYTRVEQEEWEMLPEGQRRVGNIHNTVKPVELMRYLCRITKTPTGGIVFDPFMGSGTTGVGALLEGREFVGIELDADYSEIAWKRLEWAQQAKPDNTIPKVSIPNKRDNGVQQLSLFRDDNCH